MRFPDEHPGNEVAETDGPRFIHLLFAPTDRCSLRCGYCYLDHDRLAENAAGSVRDAGCADPVETLDAAVRKLRAAGVIPFAIALHGGEVTCLSPDRFERLVDYIERYYRDNAELLKSHGFTPGRPHIKTNLYGLQPHLQAIARHGVSVSGSLDLPFSLHEKYRRTADGRPTLQAILRNVEALRGLPIKKKASATVFKEHLDRFDELCDDLVWLHENTCLDMLDFNFMVGFADDRCPLTPLSPAEQVAFYDALCERFAGTELEPGLRGAWFAEFTPDYCTGCTNCGEKFFLMNARGDMYSCVRGQGHEDFHYGNIARDSVADILATAKTKAFLAHAVHPLPDECARCAHLVRCRTGCPFVKKLEGSGKSYTCELQKRLYAADPQRYPESPRPDADAYRYALIMHPDQALGLKPSPAFVMPSDMKPLADVIASDPKLRGIFDPEAFALEVDGERHPMLSQVLRTERRIVALSRESSVFLLARKDIFDAACPWPVNNSLYIMALSGDLVVYGDEGRTKQEHVFTHQVFLGALRRTAHDAGDYWKVDLGPILRPYYDALSAERPNNLFATTSALRDYHYAKHKDNAFYHIQTVNLPFQNIELAIDGEDVQERSIG